jgi:general secretion pathway protein C
MAAIAGATLSTWMLAVGLTQIVGGACLPLGESALVFRTEVASTSSSATQGPTPAPTGRIRATTIVTNDPFDSTTHAASSTIAITPSIASPQCPGGYRLAASVIDDDAPERSLAVLESASGTALDAPLVHVGSPVGAAEVVSVGASRVWLRTSTGHCFIGTTPPTAPTSSTPPSPTNALGIQHIDDTHVAVDRAVRDALLESPQDLMRALLVAPETSGGKTIGLRLMRVTPGSLLSTLGLRVADVVRSVNGFEVGSAEKMLEAIAILKTAPTLDVAFVRDGTPKTMSIEIR